MPINVQKHEAPNIDKLQNLEFSQNQKRSIGAHSDRATLIRFWWRQALLQDTTYARASKLCAEVPWGDIASRIPSAWSKRIVLVLDSRILHLQPKKHPPWGSNPRPQG